MKRAANEVPLCFGEFLDTVRCNSCPVQADCEIAYLDSFGCLDDIEAMFDALCEEDEDDC